MESSGPYREDAIPREEITPEEPKIFVGVPEKLVEEFRQAVAASVKADVHIRDATQAFSKAQAQYAQMYARARSNDPGGAWYSLGPLHVDVVRVQAELEAANVSFAELQTLVLRRKQALVDLFVNNLLTR